MGWLFAYSKSYDKKALVADLIKPERYTTGWTLLRHSLRGNHLWTLLRRPDGQVTIGLDLLQSGGKTEGWGYKGMDETSGPYVYDCPLSFLNEASEPTGYAIEWRLKVRAKHAAKRSSKAYAGQVVDFGGRRYKLHHQAAPRKGWNVTRLSDGLCFRMNARQLSGATIVNTEIA